MFELLEIVEIKNNIIERKKEIKRLKIIAFLCIIVIEGAENDEDIF